MVDFTTLVPYYAEMLLHTRKEVTKSTANDLSLKLYPRLEDPKYKGFAGGFQIQDVSRGMLVHV